MDSIQQAILNVELALATLELYSNVLVSHSFFAWQVLLSFASHVISFLAEGNEFMLPVGDALKFFSKFIKKSLVMQYFRNKVVDLKADSL